MECQVGANTISPESSMELLPIGRIPLGYWGFTQWAQPDVYVFDEPNTFTPAKKTKSENYTSL